MTLTRTLGTQIVACGVIVATAGAAPAQRVHGLTVMSVDPAVIEEHGLPLAAKGVLVAGVDGSASRSRLKPGHLILDLNGREVGSVDELRRAARRAGRPVFRVERDGRRGRIRLGG